MAGLSWDQVGDLATIGWLLVVSLDQARVLLSRNRRGERDGLVWALAGWCATLALLFAAGLARSIWQGVLPREALWALRLLAGAAGTFLEVHLRRARPLPYRWLLAENGRLLAENGRLLAEVADLRAEVAALRGAQQ